VMDANGCKTCRCNPAPVDPVPKCLPVMCAIHCEHGNVKDENGCDICKCNPAPVDPVVCPPVCEIYCFLGNVKDENGCDTCECISEFEQTEEFYSKRQSDNDNAISLVYPINCNNPYSCLRDSRMMCTKSGKVVFGHCGIQQAICIDKDEYDPSDKCLTR